jgi:hypothetical protein
VSRTPTILLHVFVICFCHSKCKVNCICTDTVENRKRHSTIKTEGRLQASRQDRGWTIRGSNSGIRKEHYQFSKTSRPAVVPFSPVLNGYHIFPQGPKRPARDVNHSTSCSAEVTNEWSYSPTFPLWFHSAVRDNWQLAKHLSGRRTLHTKMLGQNGTHILPLIKFSFFAKP